MVSIFVETVGLLNPIFRPILKIIVDVIKWLVPSVFLRQVIQLFKHLWKKIVDIFAWIKMCFQKHKNWIVFFVTILVMVLAIIGFSNLSTEKHQNEQIAELKAFNSNAKGILDKPKDIDSLEEALTIANKLKTHINSHVKDKSYYLSIFDKEFPNYPLYTLQQVINNIYEKNRFKYEYDGSMKAISFSSDGNLVALSTSDDNIQIRPIRSVEPFKSEPNEQLNSCHSGISSLSFHSLDSNIIATGASSGGKICFLNRKEKEENTDISLTNKNKVYSITFSPKGNFLAIAQSDGQVTSINEKNRDDRSQWNPTKERTFDITFNYNEDKIATVSDTGEVNIWDYPTKPTNSNSQAKLLKRPPINTFKVPKYEKETNSFLRIMFTENDELVIVSESKNVFQVLKYSKKILINQVNKVNNITPIETIELKSSQISETISSGSFNLKNNQLITVDSQNLVQLWDLSKSKKGNIKAKGNEQYPPVTKISLSDVSGVNDISTETEKSKKNYTLSLIALHKGGNITTWSMNGLQSVNAPVFKKIKVKDIDFTAKGKKIAILNEEDTIDFFTLKPEFDSNLLKSQFKEAKNIFTTISFNPMQDDIVAIGTKAGAIKLFDKNERLLAEVPDPNGGSVQFIDFSPDGNLLVSIRDTLEIWNTSNNNKIEEIKIPPDIKLPGTIAVNIGANIALAASETKKIELLNPKLTESPKIIKLEPIKTIDFDENEKGGVIGVSFSKKNQLFSAPSSAKDITNFDKIFNRPLFAAVDNTGLVKVWDSSSQKLISSFQSETKEIKGFIIDSNGKGIFIGGNDGKYGAIEKWKIDSLEELVKNGCKWLEDYHKQHSDSKNKKYCSTVLSKG